MGTLKAPEAVSVHPSAPRIRFLRGPFDLPTVHVWAVKRVGDFSLEEKDLACRLRCPDMALFTGRMTFISRIAMDGEVWFEKHESSLWGGVSAA